MKQIGLSILATVLLAASTARASVRIVAGAAQDRESAGTLAVCRSDGNRDVEQADVARGPVGREESTGRVREEGAVVKRARVDLRR